MATELKIPELGESITEVEIGQWLKKEGDLVEKDEPVATLESDKATVELPAPARGTLRKILKQNGASAKVGETIAHLEATEARVERGAGDTEKQPGKSKKSKGKATEPKRVMPAAERVLAEAGLDAKDVEATGPGGRLLKKDVLRHVEAAEPAGQAEETEAPAEAAVPAAEGREEERVRMTPLRRKLAQRLVDAQQTAALLTTFNEVDMSAVMQLRREFGEAFQKKYEVKLGFMSFFIKAVIDGLKQFPQLNAEIRDQEIIYRNYYDIGVAIGAGKGLVVPVLRSAERLSFAELELAIADFAQRAGVNTLKIQELQGGTFTISNGGVYGSLLSTPIVNPPQSGILGMHTIQDRPIAKDGAVVIRPMMYIALTYDHRIVDGREAVTFLRRIKEAIESPSRMLLEV